MLALTACCKLWDKAWGGKRLIAKCDNMCVVIAINSGKTKDVNLQALLRELFYWSSMFSFELKAVYISTKENTIPDLLSRFHQQTKRDAFHKIATRLQLQQVPATMDLLNFTHHW